MLRTFAAFLSLLLLCSCATEKSIHSLLPKNVKMNKEAGRSDWLIVTVRLVSGEELPFVVDTGAGVTVFDKSLEPKLGKRLGTTTRWNIGVKEELACFTAPKLYLGKTPLLMTGPVIVTDDCTQISTEAGRPVRGILGMDVLQHYCIQLDFAAGKMRFLDDAQANKKDWGKPFSLTDVGDGCLLVRENLAGTKDLGSLIDTGWNDDGWLTPKLFQQWTNQAQLPPAGEVRSPNGVLGAETYPDVDLDGLDEKLLLSDDSHIKLNGIGIHFLSRHLVTLDFPNRTMYLKRTSIGPLIDTSLTSAAKAAAKSAIKPLKSLEKKKPTARLVKKRQSGDQESNVSFSS